MSKYFYRIEHRTDKVGPYNTLVKTRNLFGFDENIQVSYIVENETGLRMHDPQKHVVPQRDNLENYIDNAFRFGFRSLHQLRKWFTTNQQVYQVLEKYDMVLRRFSVKERFDGNHQSVAFTNELENGVELPFSRVYGSD